MNYIKEIKEVKFPSPTDIMINMMPIIVDDKETFPNYILSYKDMIDACKLKGLAYLSIHESNPEGKTQRRPGIHTEGTSLFGWGGGNWGGIHGGLFMASTDGACRAWNEQTFMVDQHGALIKAPKTEGFNLKPNHLYWLTDRTPHEALPSNNYRQWFRLVSDEIGIWFEKHSTPNPFGIKPNAPIETKNKFAA